MQITFEIPEDIGRALASGAVPLDRAALEGLAAEAYRSGALSESQLVRLLGLPSRFAVHEWLAARKIPYLYTEADFASDLTSLTELGLR
jgi:predicted HTH domain antitoxin